MRKYLYGLLLATVCCGCLISCNEKPRSYKFVKIMTDGKEEVESFEAKNDTLAVKEYFNRMEKIVVANMEKQDTTIKAMDVIDPEGDTLNMDETLMTVALNLAAPAE